MLRYRPSYIKDPDSRHTDPLRISLAVYNIPSSLVLGGGMLYIISSTLALVMYPIRVSVSSNLCSA